MKSKGGFILLLLVINQFVLANETIRGTIIDDENAEPLFAANAGIVGSSIGASVDFDGNFDLKLNQVFIPYHFLYWISNITNF